MNYEQTKLDKFLDEALKSYSEAEPRIGFESRIVANLRATPPQPWWHGRFAYASAAIVVVCAMSYGVWRLGLADTQPQIAPPQAIANSVSAPEVVRSRPLVVSTLPVRERPLIQGRTRRIEDEHPHTVLASQLPLPMPLTQQERLLLAFARENPQEILSTAEWQERMRQPAEEQISPDQGER